MKQYHKYYLTSVSLTFLGKVTLTDEAYAHAINMPVHGGNSFLYIDPKDDKYQHHLTDNKMSIEEYNAIKQFILCMCLVCPDCFYSWGFLFTNTHKRKTPPKRTVLMGSGECVLMQM